MGANLKGRNFVSILDFSAEELMAVLDTARGLKAQTVGGADFSLNHFAMDRVFGEQRDQEVAGFEFSLNPFRPIGTHQHYLVNEHIVVFVSKCLVQA